MPRKQSAWCSTITTMYPIKTSTGTILEVVKDFKYLGSWTQSSLQNIKTRNALAWKACNKLTKIWKSNLPRSAKVKLFQATVESILLYGSETWTVTTKVRKMLDGCYTRLLMQPSMANLNSPSSRVVKDSTPFRRRISRCKNFGKGES